MKKFFATALLVALALMFVVAPATADHSWANYHWARSSNPISLTLGNNVTSAWDFYLTQAIADWNQSSVLDLTEVAGSANVRRCNAASGTIEVCSAKYGNNGWLGLASISVSGNHINAAYSKMNDSYFCSGCTYDTPAWRALVMCQEIGHDFGLGHNDEDFNTTLGTCMDYSSDPGPNQHPDAHDFEQLETIYAHLDASATAAPTTRSRAPSLQGQIFGSNAWGDLVARSDGGHREIYMLDLGDGNKIFTVVTWALGSEDLGEEPIKR